MAKHDLQAELTRLLGERDHILVTEDVDGFIAKMLKETGVVMEPLVALGAIHKARYEVTTIDAALRHASREWLESHGLGRLMGLPWPEKGTLPE